MSAYEHPQFAAVKALALSVLAGTREVLGYDEAQVREDNGTLPKRYVLLSVHHREGAPRFACGRTSSRGWRAVFRIVGTEDERNATRARLDAITDERVSLAGASPMTHESDDESDGDLLSIWIYATARGIT